MSARVLAHARQSLAGDSVQARSRLPYEPYCSFDIELDRRGLNSLFGQLPQCDRERLIFVESRYRVVRLGDVRGR